MQTEVANEFLTIPELAALLRLSEGTIRSWIDYRRNIPFCKLGKRVFFRRTDVDAFIAASRHMPVAE